MPAPIRHSTVLLTLVGAMHFNVQPPKMGQAMAEASELSSSLAAMGHLRRGA
jgi:hypothetical protein